MKHDGRFFARPLWVGTYASFAFVALFNLGLDLYFEGPWWRKLVSVYWLLVAIWALRYVRLAWTRPVVTLDDEFLEVRHPLAPTATTRIPRQSVVGVAWSYPADLGVQFRDGGTAPISVAVLTRRDRDTLRGLLAESR